MSKNGLTLKSGFGVVHGHWKWHGSINHVRLSISPPLVPFSSYLMLNNTVTLKSGLKVTRSLKLVPLESLGVVSYSPSTVTMAVSLAISEILSVKEWADLEMWVWGCSRSLKMAPFDRYYTSFYWSAIVSIAVLYHFQVILCWIIVTLKRSLKVIQTGTIRKLGCGFLFAFHSNYDRIFNRLWDIRRQRIAWPWRRSIDQIRPSISLPL